jgi:hypothetical protein
VRTTRIREFQNTSLSPPIGLLWAKRVAHVEILLQALSDEI